MKTKYVYSLLTLGLFTMPSFSAEFYTGLGVGVSSLSPEMDKQELDSQQNLAGTLFLGTGLGRHIALEGSYSYLNHYDIAETGYTVKYQSYGLNGLLYWPSLSNEWSVYGKAGVNYLDANLTKTSNNKDFKVDHDVSLAAGLGIRWNFHDNWFARLEYNVYDRDYSAAFIQIARIWGNDSRQVVSAQAAPEVHSVTKTSVENMVAPQPTSSAKVFNKMTLNSRSFKSGSSELNVSSDPVLSQLVTVLKLHPKAKVEIIGHTDSIGESSYNRMLSIQRAEEVGHFLESEGIDSSRISIDGQGETQPIASNSTAEGRAKNRRVEVTIPEFEYIKE